MPGRRARNSKRLAEVPADGAPVSSTARRRLVQPLWSALDAHVGPHVARGALLCVSGGPDSRALLEACARWPSRGAVRVAAVDHRTRSESAAEAHAIVARAHALGFDAQVLAIAGGPVLADEAALRDARYRALAAHAHTVGAHALVLAHHKDDVAESALLSWLGEGGGPLVAIADRGDLVVIRPFLALTRAELALARAALGARGAFVDPERASARARLRSDVLAALPARDVVVERVAVHAQRRAADDQALLDLARRAITRGADGALVVHTGAPALLRRALTLALGEMLDGRDPRGSGRALDRIVALVAAGKRGARVHLAGGVVAQVREIGTNELAVRLAVGPVPAYAVGVPVGRPGDEEVSEEDS